MEKVLVAIIGLLLAGSLSAKEVVVTQKDKKFDKTKIKAKIGDTIIFKNDDPFQHNVYSLSKGNSFQIKTQEPGGKSPVKLDPKKNKPGKMVVECAIHPTMKLEIEITK